MIVEVGSQIIIREPTREVINWCKNNLTIDNPEYANKLRMNLWTGGTPKKLHLYSEGPDEVIVPFGVFNQMRSVLKGSAFLYKFKVAKLIDYNVDIPLYDYQSEAATVLYSSRSGILQSPAGSGKTQIGIALATMLGVKTLWLTHTKDLLNQSKQRAEQYIDPSMLGTITEGKINIGSGITFATVQTLSNCDLNNLSDEWDCVIVDECHRVSGTPTAVTMFSKVLNALNAPYKYGLSATVYRADGLIKATYAMLGEVVWNVPATAVKSKIMKVAVTPIHTSVTQSFEYQNYDGTLNYTKLINYLVRSEDRNKKIVEDLVDNDRHFNLILSDRVSHLKNLLSMLPEEQRRKAVMIDGTMTSKNEKLKREQAIEEMRTGQKRYLFATYSLAREGLDIPRLDRLYMTTPKKDYVTIVQSVGRIARTFPGKDTPIVYDYVDSIPYLERKYKQRCTHYRKCGCELRYRS